MITVLEPLPGFRALQVLYRSARTTVIRAQRTSDGAAVVLKTLSADHPTLVDLALLRREGSVLQRLQGDGVVRLLAQEESVGRLLLVLADSHGRSVAERAAGRPLPPVDVVNLATAVANALATVHREGFVHRDLCPSNLVVTPSNTVEIVDFGLATNLVDDATERAPVGTLSYMSPEHTGRTGHPVDARSDLYSLGATLYELLTGAPPFVSADSLEVVHAHLARLPVPPHVATPDVPRGLSDVVMRLLAKSPADRYQSAEGVAHDLDVCRKALDERGQVDSFSLATRDVPRGITIPQRLYGRERECAAMHDALQRTCDGAMEICLVWGPPGVGKSSLVGDLRRGHGALVVGKGDPLGRLVPYAPVAGALGERLRQILSLPADEMHAWRQIVQAAVGDLGGVLAETIPEMTALLGPRPHPPELSEAEAANRMDRALTTAIQCLSEPQRPLVLFLDDLQWADLGTMRVIEALAAEAEKRSLLLVAAWRSDELDAAHPLPATLERLRASSARVTELPLDDLGFEPVGSLLEETLRCSAEEAARLARVVERKTRGNPFFLRQFLIDLQARGYLRFSLDEQRWCWSAEEIERADITDNVVRMLEGRLTQLPPHTLEALQVAACAGPRFPLQLMADALGLSPTETVESLRPALEDGLVLARGGDTGLLEADAHLRFLHDRVHEAVDATLSAPRRAAVHLAMGRRLRAAAERDTLLLFEAARHLNLAVPLLEDAAERLEVARLDLRAGRRALRAGAFDTASTCLQTALALVGNEQGWRDHYELVLELHLHAATAASFLGRVEQSEAWLDAIPAHGASRFDQARALQVRARSRMRSGHYTDAFAAFLDALDLLDEHVPRRSSRVATAVHLGRTMLAVTLAGVDNLASLPASEEPTHTLTMSLLSQAVPCAFLIASDVVPRFGLRIVERSLRNGRTPQTSTGLASLAVIQSAVVGNVTLGERLGAIALTLAEASEHGPEQVRTRFLVHHLVDHWTRPHHPVVASTPDLYRACLDAGDHDFAQFLAWAWCRGTYLSGDDLATIGRRLETMEPAVRALRRGDAPPYWRAQRRVVEHLRHGGDLESVRDDLQACAAQAEDDQDLVTISICASESALLHLLYGEPTRAVRHIDRLLALLPSMPGVPEAPYHHYLASLVRLAALPAIPPAEARGLRRKVRASHDLLARWARYCPQNNAHRVLLIDAEAARADGDRGSAAEIYDRAIAAAREHGFCMDEAFALERAGLLYLEDRRLRPAAVYLEDAQQAWRRWGADGKAAHLCACHDALLARLAVRPGAAPTPPLDTLTAIKAAHAISGELVWESLLQRLLGVAMENAGARRAVLILDHEGTLRVEAEGVIENAGRVELAPRPLREVDSLAASVVRYAVRTGDTVVVDDAVADPNWAGDLYVRRARPRSILAVPILSLGRTEGILYLENNLGAGVFTRDRAELLRLLAAQMAISLQNARQVLEIQSHQEEILAERELRHAQEMRGAALEARKNGLAAYLGIASHDLKSPLASIQMWARQVGDGQLDPSRARAYIEEACRRATGLVRTYLDAVAVETGGHLALTRRTFDLARLVEDEVDFLLRRYLPEERALVALEWDLEPVVLDADPDRLGQVVGNLVGNALEYCPIGTRIAVTLSRNDGCARLVLEDEGPGIPEEMREGLFRPFERGNHELSSSGLGLWISRVIIEAHGGHIGLEDPPRGTRFWLEIPLRS